MTGISKQIYDEAQEATTKQIVINLLKDGTLSPERIAEVTGQTLQKVLDIKEKEGI